jgi:arylsulfatase A-like enzyme
VQPTTRRRFFEAAGASAALAALGPPGVARAADRPNVVLIVLDTLRADHVFGSRARTPNMDALARDGISFTRAYPEAMPTVAARNSILTGRRRFPFHTAPQPRDLGDVPGWAPLGDVGSAFTSVLRRAGYWTAYATDNPFLGFSRYYRPFRRSFDAFAQRGGQLGGKASGVSERELRHWLPPGLDNRETRDRMRRYLANGGYSRNDSRSFAARVFRDAVRLLEEGARRRPFALVVDTFQPHEPWTPPRRYIDLYGDPDYRGPEPALPLYGRTTEHLRGRGRRVLTPRMRALYAASVTMTDRWLGMFLERLHDLRLERETVIVLVADHGFFLGERGWTGKIAARLHPELTRVPLIVVDPAHRRAGRRSRYFASTHDIARTVLSMVDVRVPEAMQGTDLSRFFAGRRPAERDVAWGGYENYFYIRTGRWALFGDNLGRDLHLFDLRRDPGERRDLAQKRRGKARELHHAALRRAVGRLPFYYR